MGKKIKAIIEWIEAFNYLLAQDIKYFKLSINTRDKNLFKKYREISEYYEARTKELLNAYPK